jgi:hypothetical protein
VTPTQVFLRNGAPEYDHDVNAHAIGVAGVMIADGMTNKGVAPDAKLVASAFRTPGTDPGYQHTLLSMEQVATRNNDDVPAVNMSFSKPRVKLTDPFNRRYRE